MLSGLADPKVEKFSSALPDTVLIQIFGDAKSVRLELCLRTSGDCQNGEKSEAHCFEASPPSNMIELKQLKDETLRNISGKSDMSDQSNMKVEIRHLFAMPAHKKLEKCNFPHVHIMLIETTALFFSQTKNSHPQLDKSDFRPPGHPNFQAIPTAS